MNIFGKEREPMSRRETPEDITEHIEDIPEEIEAHEGVKRTVSQFNAKVSDDSGNNLIQSQANQNVTISIPQDDQVLNAQSKGSADDSSTWLAVFFRRLIKKAILYGWKIIRGENKTSESN